MAKYTVGNLNKFLLLKLPSAYLSGVRVKSFADNEAVATVKHRWINQKHRCGLSRRYWTTVQTSTSEARTNLHPYIGRFIMLIVLN